MKKILLLLISACLIATISLADIPNTINYQGRLMNSQSQPVIDEQYNVTFRLYTALSGGNMVWEEGQQVRTSNGYFNVVLGNETELNTEDFNKALWVSTQIGNELELVPRQKLGTSAYAMNVADGAITTDKIADGAVTARKLNGEIQTGQILDNAISTAKIKNDSVTFAKIATGADLPVGTILPWHKNILSLPLQLPEQYAECNGQMINDSQSPFHEKSVPNLNGGKRFLRGSDHSGDFQKDSFRSHSHKYSRWGTKSGWGFQATTGVASTLSDKNTTEVGGDETRPVNMSVVWIIKIK